MDAVEETSLVTCPSSKCTEGAKLIGIVKENGYVDMLKTPIKIDPAFISTAKQGRTPELRFRFANKCIKHGCKQWVDGRCSIVDKIVDHVRQANTLVEQAGDLILPNCSIRSSCRWFNQVGPEACKICPFVITDVSALRHDSV